MPFLRRLPPVYSAVRLPTVWTALRTQISARVEVDNELALDAAASRLGRLYPSRDILLTDSGTSALTLALLATKPPNVRMPSVALPAFACPDVGTAAVGAGYQIFLYDVDPDTLSPDLDSLRRCFLDGASHVVVVHLFGRLVDLDIVSEMAGQFGAVVIEDAAQHAGGSLNGVRGGALADWSVLSFGRGKGLNAGGGGALLRAQADGANTGKLAIQGMAASIVTLARALAAEVLSHPSLYWLPAALPVLQLGATKYKVPRTARTANRSSELLLIDALDHESVDLESRRAIERRYWDSLDVEASRRRGILLAKPPSRMLSGALRFPIRLQATIPNELAARGVARSYPRTLADYHQIFERTVRPSRETPGARELARSLYTLPTHSRVESSDCDAIIHGILQMVTGQREALHIGSRTTSP
jgi:dTDP-4-amino-4,6-dideoxygalactose transaminase